MRDYVVFHDESKGDRNNEFWHAFFWVPSDFLPELADCLRTALINSGFIGTDRSFKQLGTNQSAHRYAHCWLTAMKSALQNCKQTSMDSFDCGKIRNVQARGWTAVYRKFSRLPCCKLSIFFLPNGLKDLAWCKDNTACFETTFRMGMKGGMHKLFSEAAPCRITNIWLDRERHFQRPLDKLGLLRRLSCEARNYVMFSDGCAIEGEDVPEREMLVRDALDILLGSFRHSYAHGLSVETKAKAKKRKLTKVTHDLLERLCRGDGMKNSRFRDGYAFRKAWLEDGEWRFDDLHHDIISRVTPEDRQIEMRFPDA